MGAPADAPMPPKSDESTPLKAKEGEPAVDTQGLPFYAKYMGPKSTMAISIALQMSFGVTMSIANKEMTSEIDAPCLMTTIQMAFTALVLCTVFAQKQHFGSQSDVLRWLSGPPLLFGLQLASSMIGTSKLSLAAATNIRNLSPFVVLPIEKFVTEKAPVSAAMLLALLTTSAGVSLFFIGSDHSSTQVMGVIWLTFNMIIAITIRLVERRFLAGTESVKKVDISITSALFLNNLIGLIPVIFVLFFVQEEAHYGELRNASLKGWMWLFI
jgi:drug/metabolite transporter (DMT)-like permease